MLKMKCFVVCVRVLLLTLVLAVQLCRVSGIPRYPAATPHTPVKAKINYIPLHYGSGYEEDTSVIDPTAESTELEQTSGVAPSELILSVFRTVLDVVRGINAKKKASSKIKSKNNTALTIPNKKSTKVHKGRGFEDYYDDHHHEETTTTPKPVKQSRYTDPWAGYYDFIINEGSFKFWSIFQLFTTAVLFYACLSAIYYSKFNPVIPDYDREYDDYFLERTSGRQTRSVDSQLLPSGLSWMNANTFQFILEAIAKHYET